MKNYNKNVISSFLQYLDANNLYGWAICKKLPAGKFKWAKKTSIYKKQAIKMYNENGDYGAILEVDIETLNWLQQMKKEENMYLNQSLCHQNVLVKT